MTQWPKRWAIAAVRFYQRHLSGLKPAATCRFEPTCSAYTLEALQEYGFVRGIGMGVIRLLKCGPWHPGGYDPVPKYPGHPDVSPRHDHR
ncbi:membrane protein insertion efficiency factor YidD [Corynebacterium tapiri]|uniref:Putative membrane protein insertion efficiency factor n=1 Tax=Corynebacterium tapiri TaxID=1448266 RepID=A0A5C4U406_9CORY|nr:membrane protein insertion efficiency factor YidD [Corynebacterium tapiri]TNL96859.1 membrane protein insertion efficiency factor YidD [Corynebacterium tapiri]